mgnify:CR=1 FL=1
MVPGAGGFGLFQGPIRAPLGEIAKTGRDTVEVGWRAFRCGLWTGIGPKRELMGRHGGSTAMANGQVAESVDRDGLGSSQVEGVAATEAMTDDELLQLVTFEVGSEEFAIPILSVQEINRMMEITRVPQSPRFVEGVINLRGKIIPVVDLRQRFGMERAERNGDNRIIVVEVSGRVIGFTVDRVNEVLRIDSGIVEPAPAMVASLDSDYVQGVGKLPDRLLILLELGNLFRGEELEKLEQAVAA